MSDTTQDHGATAQASGTSSKPGMIGADQTARAEMRRETALRASIRLQDGTEIPAMVRDISLSGARLGIPAGRTLPESFMFKLHGRDLVFRVKLAWQRGGYAGVHIEQIAKLASAR